MHTVPNPNEMEIDGFSNKMRCVLASNLLNLFKWNESLSEMYYFIDIKITMQLALSILLGSCSTPGIDLSEWNLHI